MKLAQIAHARAGDKGTILTISVIAFQQQDYPLLEKYVTAERVTRLFSSLISGAAERYCIPGLGALNFVLHRPRTESVTRSLALDAHGKALSYVLLDMDVDQVESF